MTSPNGAPLVLVVGKKRTELDSLVDWLLAAGFNPRLAETIAATWRCVIQDTPFALVLDTAGDAGAGAWNLCRELAEGGEHLILVLTAGESPAIQSLVVSHGADFHIALSPGYEQLVCQYLERQRSRRQHIGECPTCGTGTTNDARCTSTLQIDGANRLVYRNGRAIHLTKRELALFQVLAGQPERTVPLDEICRALWDTKPLVAAVPLLKQYIARLRYKIEPDPSRPIHFETVRGAGYCFHFTGMSMRTDLPRGL